jgi:2-polyprenyl-3-methyl-5-hydroxy-6-metoxy-1,4-benzoquinol methylase
MNFYQSLAPFYDEIFGWDEEEFAFYQQFAIDADSVVLDAGCSTGDLSVYLSSKVKAVKGFDLDWKMLELAEVKKNKFKLVNCYFQNLSLLAMKTSYLPASFSHIFCVGNVLVHLATAAQILDFFQQSFLLLQEGGKLIIQILNYGRILQNKIGSLAVIKTENLCFERFYDQHTPDSILFKTRLTFNDSDKIQTNEITLFPVTSDKIQQLAIKAGFTVSDLYGNTNNDPFVQNSPMLIVILVK